MSFIDDFLYDIHVAAFEPHLFETKVCRACFFRLPRQAFYKNKDIKDGLYSLCKRCKAIRNEKWTRKNHTHRFLIYYLPQHHYIGATSRLLLRLALHRSLNKFITSDYQIVLQSDDLTDIQRAEQYLHEKMGYYGANYGFGGYVRYFHGKDAGQIQKKPYEIQHQL